jgi:hypothetical protein
VLETGGPSVTAGLLSLSAVQGNTWYPGFGCLRGFRSELIRDGNQTKELSQHLEDLIRHLRQYHSAYYVQKSRYENRIDKARENHKISRDELEDLRQKEVETNQQIKKYEVEVEDLKKQLILKTSLEAIKQRKVTNCRQ